MPPEIALPDGTVVPVTIRENARARRILLRVEGVGGRVVLTVPPYADRREALEFARDRADWVADRLQQAVVPRPFDPGAFFPFDGGELEIVHAPNPGSRRASVRREGDTLRVSGSDDAVSGLVRDWLRGEARRRFKHLVDDKSARLGKTPGRLFIRDTSSRWGSCSYNGNLSFSWRLIMAPPDITDYVAAHEVAHLAEHNHGPRFWQHVEDLAENDVKAARAWLRREGPSLHRYG